MRASRAIIHLENLKKNLEIVREKIGTGTKICFCVKADAYGHGAIPVSQYALENGADCLAVALVSEGKELRKAGINSRIFLLSQALPEEIDEIINTDLIPLVSDRDFINALAAGASDVAAAGSQSRGNQFEVHLKIDTGMNRLGCGPDEALDLATLIANNKNLQLGVIASHFSVADSTEPEDIAYTRAQITCFNKTIEEIRKAGIDPGELHASNSGAICFHKEANFDMVRPGIMLYGYSPMESEIKPAIKPSIKPSIKPLLELQSAVVHIKRVSKGEEVSYGRTWKAPDDTHIGIIPIGYADGLPRLLSNQYQVQIKGKAYPLVGRICMDQCMVNLGNRGEVERWDKAIIFGPEFTNAQDIARITGTIPYEILCNINKRVPRLYLK